MQFVKDKPTPPDELAELLKANDPTVTAELDALQAPVQRLMEVLQAQNCLVVAAAGNDSVTAASTGARAGIRAYRRCTTRRLALPRTPCRP